MLAESFFMIRDGEFGTNFDAKLLLGIIGLAVCLYYWRAEKRRDYLWVFAIGSIIWFAIEFAVQAAGTRVMEPAYVMGAQIPMAAAAALRGIAEGGLVILTGLLFADKLLDAKERKRWLAILALLVLFLLWYTSVQALPSKDVGGDVASRRDLFTGGSIAIMGLFSVLSIVWIARAGKKTRARALMALLVMIVLTGLWTIAEFAANVRWIEAGTTASLSMAPPLWQFIGLGYDVVVEIGLMYLGFLAIAYMLGLVKEGKR